MIFLCLIIILLIIFLFISKKRVNKRYAQYENEYKSMSSEYQQKQTEYESFYRNVNEKEEIKKETAKRRRITVKDKRAVLERDNYTCQICGISKSFVDGLCPGLGDYLLLEIDHINSVSNGGSGDDLTNLQTLCWRCNRKKGAKKTNKEVENIIDYGMDHLINPLSRSEILRMHSFKTMPRLIDFIVSEFDVNRTTVLTIVDKVKKSGVSPGEKIPLAIKTFCKLLDENRI